MTDYEISDPPDWVDWVPEFVAMATKVLTADERAELTAALEKHLADLEGRS